MVPSQRILSLGKQGEHLKGLHQHKWIWANSPSYYSLSLLSQLEALQWEGKRARSLYEKTSLSLTEVCQDPTLILNLQNAPLLVQSLGREYVLFLYCRDKMYVPKHGCGCHSPNYLEFRQQQHSIASLLQCLNSCSFRAYVCVYAQNNPYF